MNKEFILINKKFIYNDYTIEKTVIVKYYDSFYYIKKNKVIKDMLCVSSISYKNKPSYRWIKIL